MVWREAQSPALGDLHIIVCGVEFGNRKQFAGEDIEGRFAVAGNIVKIADYPRKHGSAASRKT
jgi:hypothetical protein